MTGAVTKPLGIKAYGSIPHLPGSRLGPADRTCHLGQARIATERPRDALDQVWVQEKLDGSCVAVAKHGGEIIPLIRAGYRAIQSRYYQHILFDQWVRDPENYQRFDALLDEGERAVGEWLAQAHGTRYQLTAFEDPFVLFDIMAGAKRLTLSALNYRQRRVEGETFSTPAIIGAGPTSIADVIAELAHVEPDGTRGYHGALDPPEGAVWRVERDGEVDFLVKWVRPDKVDGCYLESVTGSAPVWNWTPNTTNI